MTQQEYLLLARKIAEGNASDEELALYNASFEAFQQAPQSIDELDLPALREESISGIRRITLPDTSPRKLWPRLVSAASVILILSAGAYFLLRPSLKNTRTQHFATDVPPGKNQAILTLASGQKIALTEGGTGTMATEGGICIIKTGKGVSYQQNDAQHHQEVLYNTITTPLSGQQEVILSDGSRVMLDANSSITFPVTFSAAERKVSMTGQAYFTVQHNASRPFRVAVKGQMIEDLGTEFNINAYDDEPGMKTTLVEGMVSVNRRVLKPGEQALVTADRLEVRAADLEAVTAWKEGNFSFHNEDLESAMRQLGRWYNVKVVYENAPKELHIGGDISRKRNLSVVLRALGRTGRVKFRIEDQTIYVSQ